MHSAQWSVEMWASERSERDVGTEERMGARQSPEGHTLRVLLRKVEPRELGTALPAPDALVAARSEGQIGCGYGPHQD